MTKYLFEEEEEGGETFVGSSSGWRWLCTAYILVLANGGLSPRQAGLRRHKSKLKVAAARNFSEKCSVYLRRRDFFSSLRANFSLARVCICIF